MAEVAQEPQLEDARRSRMAALVEELREREGRDPGEGGFVRLSRHDDATAILLV